MLIDTHCHLDFPEFKPDLDQVIERARQFGIDYIVNVGSSIKGSQGSIELAKKYPCVWAVVGIHPHEADNVPENAAKIISDLAKNEKVSAIGEIGLDYFKNFSLPENQRPLFIRQLELAKELNLPVVLHSRDAQKDTLGILKDFLPIEAVVHCFSGDEKFLKDCLDLGFFISFTCNVTYKKADNIRELVRLAPLEKIMLETDCPYLSPEGFRGKRNEPYQVRLLAEKIAQIKNTGLEQVAQNTTLNAKKFFKLP